MEAVRGLQNRAAVPGEPVISQPGYGGKGKSKGERRAEERSRSISFKVPCKHSVRQHQTKD
eukprot:11126336-Karenia_brevis.AAC.1